MLPAALLTLEPGAASPRYLRGRDEPWLRLALGEYADLAGLARRALEDAWRDRVEPALLRAGAPRLAALGVKVVLDRATQDEVDSALSPERAREAVFLRAAGGGGRDDVLRQVAEELGVTASQLERALFADRPGAKIVRRPAKLPTPAELAERYNLALVQGLLFRAEVVRVHVEELSRAVVRYAKLRGLLASFVPSDGGVWIELSGPLALFRHTLKYGRALAAFFPAVVAVPGFHLEARCRLGSGTRDLRIDAGDPLERTFALPRDVDSAVERAFVRDLRRASSAWRIARESIPLRAGRELFFPDFTLSRGPGERVLVEIVGYYTRDYLARKARAAAAAGADPVILCADDALDCGEHDFAGAALVLRYHRRVDAAAVLAAAEAVLAR